jgi:hypothetical protein
MALIIYSQAERGHEKILWEIIKTPTGKRKIEIYQSFHKFKERLQKPIFNVELTVLITSDCEDLTRIFSLSDFLSDMKIMIVLPSKDPQMITKARTLHPLSITCPDSDGNELETL